MNKNTVCILLIPALLILCFACGLFGTVSAYRMNENPYDLVSSCYTDRLIAGYGNVPVFHTDGTVTRVGIIETTPHEQPRRHWQDENEQIITNTREEMTEYFFPKGPVILYGYDLLGTICVGIWKEADTVPKTRDEIYAVIDREARHMGIKDIPVIFIRESMPDARALFIPTFSETPYIRTLQETANGYPPCLPQTDEPKTPSGITHCSVTYLIEKITPGYWLG
ncbi:hypothetical protein L0665_03945 [Methanogenium marinum]|uniref:Uncharacterized protein n=1 Tax=Methanogenium marinum TaxID=348610 RepID=A0A9Q4KT69_9EURY|nr:hypothetical protein [Methanogenium marinum]MDE4907763.1 hypothetical protein [Methanogenium marinum]